MLSMLVGFIVVVAGLYIAMKLLGFVAKLAIVVVLVLLIAWRIGPAVGIHLPF